MGAADGKPGQSICVCGYGSRGADVAGHLLNKGSIPDTYDTFM